MRISDWSSDVCSSDLGEGIPGEIGRGGSYTIVHADGREEKAVGFSIYLDPLVSAGLGRSERRRVFLPLGTEESVAAGLRAQGCATVAAIAQGCNGTKPGGPHHWHGLEAAPHQKLRIAEEWPMFTGSAPSGASSERARL